jgi:hypothetical protein
MKLTYVSHACLLMEHEQLKIVTDPWFNGPAYLNQWHVFPRPADTSFVHDVTHIILTHGHEDHLHLPTLNLMNKNAKVYYPYTWSDGARKRLQNSGFKDVQEVSALKKIKLADNVFATFIVNGLDAFVVYEFDGKVFVNLNDALNAHHWSFVEMFVGMLRKHWKGVDLLICGLGGAGYFPNTVHAPNKNDEEIGHLREQFLAHKFLEIVEEIKPRAVMPFVPGFALLEYDKQWINGLRFSRNKLQDYYQNHFPNPHAMQFHNLFPGDFIEDEKWHKVSSYHQLAIDDNLSHLVSKQYATEIEEANTLKMVGKEIVYELAGRLTSILPVSKSGIAPELLEQVNFVIAFKDVPESLFIHCMFNNGKLETAICSALPAGANIKITTYTHRLNYALKELWGGDVFYIGYGADLEVLDEVCLKDNIDIVSLRLLSRFPAASRTMLRKPLRAAKYLSGNPGYAALALKQKLITRGNMNKLPYNERSHWINKGKCDVCMLCDIPLLSDEFGELLQKNA